MFHVMPILGIFWMKVLNGQSKIGCKEKPSPSFHFATQRINDSNPHIICNKLDFAINFSIFPKILREKIVNII